MYLTQFLMLESLTKFMGRHEPATARARSWSPCFCCSGVQILAKQIKRNPLEIAEKVCQDLINGNIDYIDDITVTPPGFINFVIDKKFYQDNLKLIIKNGVEFGKDLSVKKRTANVEFVSANPTGPLTVGHGRNAVIGDTV